MQRTAFRVNEMAELRGCPVYDSNGEKIGDLNEIYYDDSTKYPEWFSLGTGFLGMNHVLVPVEGCERWNDGLRVRYSKQMVKDSPDVRETDGHIAEDQERELYNYYGLSYSESRPESMLPEGGTQWQGQEQHSDTMTRSEEELHIGKRQVEAGKVRLRKWVDTEPVSEQVELRRETYDIERQPIDRPASEGEIGEQEIEARMMTEEPVIQKETIAKEEIGLKKSEHTKTEDVSGDLRKERVEIDEDIDEESR